MRKIISSLLIVLMLFLFSVPVLASISSDIVVLDIFDYVNETVLGDDGKLTYKFSFPNNGIILRDQFTGTSTYSYFNSNTLSSESFIDGHSYQFIFPYCDSAFSFGLNYLSTFSNKETFDISAIPPGTSVNLSANLNLNFTSLTKKTLYIRFCYECFDKNGNIIDDFQIPLTYFNGITGDTSVKISKTETFISSGLLHFTFIIPEGSVYFCPYIQIYNVDNEFNGSISLSDLKMSYTVEPKSVLPDISVSWDLGSNPHYVYGTNIPALQVIVDEVGYGFYSYQWYSGHPGTISVDYPYGHGQLIQGAISDTYYPNSSIVGSSVYYCVVTHTIGIESFSTLSPVANFTIDEKPPDVPTVIPPDNEEYDCVIGGSSLPEFNANASVSDGGTLTYQWYKGSNPTTGTIIPHATSPTYKPAPNQEGTWYYWCEVTNTNSAGSETVKTTPIKIVVKRPTIDDITVNWGNKPIQITKGYPYTLKVNIPNGLFDSYTLQWYIYHDATYKELISGATGASFVIPTETLGVKRYYCVIRGTQGDTTISTMKLTPDIIIVDEDSSDITSDSNTGITWNWGNSPIRLKINQYKILQVFVPDSLDVTVVQWYRQSVFGQPEPISGANDYYYEVPTNKVGTWKYTCAMVFKDGSGFSCTADVVVLENGSFDSGGSDPGGAGTGSNSINNDMFFNPTIKNNLDLVQWALNAYNNGWGYVTGTYGQILTQDLLDMKAQQYPDNISQYYDFIQTHWLNRRTADCIGLIKGYCWYDPADGEIKYNTNGCPDKDPDSMFAWCTEERGPMSTMPEIPGIMLYKGGHVGIYIGNGWVIEARGTQFGVIKTHIDDLAWTNWAKLPCITYLDNSGTDDDNDEEILGGLAGIWQSLKNLPQALLDGIKGLFVPDAQDIAEYSQKWQTLLANRFGAIYQSVDVIDQFASGIQEADQTNTVYFPIVSLSLAGAEFSFGGWDVQIVPTGFDFIITTLKRIISIVATLAFINAMRIKFEKILGGSAA